MKKEKEYLLYIMNGGNKFIRIGKKIGKNVYWGFMDGNGKEVIPCRYYRVGPFSDGLACVSDGEKEYFINEEGENVFELDERYQYGLFHDGRCEIRPWDEDRHGYVNKKGEIISPIEDGTPEEEFFSEGLQVHDYDMGDSPCNYVNEKGHVVIVARDLDFYNGSDFHDHLASASHTKYGLYGYLDQRGQVVIPFEFTNAFAWDHGMAPVSIDGKWGFIDMDMNVLIPFQYCLDWYNFDDEGVLLYKRAYGKDPDTGEPCDFEYGAIDRSGRELIPETLHGVAKIDGKIAILAEVEGGGLEVKWLDIEIPQSDEHVYEFECEGLDLKKVAKLKDGLLRWGFVNSENEEIIPCLFDDAMYESGIIRVKKDGLWAFISADGKFLTPFLYQSAFAPFAEGLSAVQRNGLWGFLNKNGEEVIPCRYDAVTDFGEGRSMVLLETMYGFIDSEGREITPLKYLMAYPFSEGLAWVHTYEGKGSINRDGDEVVPCRFYRVGECSEGLVSVCERGRKGKKDHYMFLDTSGNTAIDLNGIDPDAVSIFKEGLCGIRKEGRWGFIDRMGKQVIPCKFNWPYFNVQIQFEHGLCCIQSFEHWRLIGAINTEGKVVIPPVYRRITWEEDGRWAAETKEDTHYYNSEGKRI